MKSLNSKILFFGLCVVLFILMIISTTIGSVHFSFAEVFRYFRAAFSNSELNQTTEFFMFWNIRLPRIMLGVLCGAGLSVCGVTYQSLFRNPLCDPYILGISSGAALGAATAIVLGFENSWLGVTGFALLFALITILLIIQVSRLGNRLDHSVLLLSGVSINFLLTAVLTFLMVVNQSSMDKIIFWSMGSFASASWLQILILTIIVLVGTFWLRYYAKDLNILMHHAQSAVTLGVNVRRTKMTILWITTIMIAFIVAFCGVIGFVGLIIPHIVRLIVGSDHRQTIPLSLVFGALFMLLADVICRTAVAPGELPVGSITAILGTPFFIYLLSKRSYNDSH